MSTPLIRMYDTKKSSATSAPPTPPRSAGASRTISAGTDQYRQCVADEITELKPSLNDLLIQHIGDLESSLGYGYSPEIWTNIIRQALIVYDRTLRAEEITRGGQDKAGRLILNIDEFTRITANSYAYTDSVGLSTEIVRIGNLRFIEYTRRITGNPDGVPPITFAPMDADGGFGIKILHGSTIEQIDRLLNFIVTNPPPAQAQVSCSATRKPSK